MLATTPSKQRGGMMRIGSIRPEYEFDDEEAGVFVQWILAFLWIFKALVEVKLHALLVLFAAQLVADCFVA
ncbi:hypothetical protein Bca4012_088565 [Brassica carinata]|uniref:Uncharacterized protein n=1 Tax=Brassica carinata TaxID=52824 RepID=A0A8X7PC52_BRACI|nr:hypothetical protein Bca52824_087840 [Brassica carinata]